ncbi:hypothetical protein NSK_008676 [Nannochloropsis salina CCMP1776]|uniref:Uncharacterized protein n=1 Tax=Nannochloropsis salina CCMP1776 TaxID=1027361 RepID=A0A4D9CTR9_9STRA|nr:hypothetical protein NSK_008676 [Nannochloropsis salina CCMP1776]|eukprot:TFJ80119.1 hypothetical protein NSK_008676 [Nannochloropsis salina CCMP1776]
MSCSLQQVSADSPDGPYKVITKRKRQRSSGADAQKCFHDLCIDIPHQNTTVEHVREATRRLGHLGYTCVAFNETVVGRDGVRGLDRPASLKTRRPLWLAAQGGLADKPEVRLRRVTVVVHDKGEAQFLCGAIRSVKWADLVAARPTSDQALQLLCEAGDVDIISLDISARMGFSLNTSQADAARARGIAFEVQYAGLISEENLVKRQQLMANTSGVLGATRGRGVVWSSGSSARAAWDTLRGPYDVMNLAVILGLREEPALRSLTGSCQEARGHARARRLEWLPAEVKWAGGSDGGGSEGKVGKEGEGAGEGEEEGEEEEGEEEEKREIGMC